MKRRGRKGKLTESLIVQAEKLVLRGNFDITVCQALGITTQSWYRWLSDGEAILENKPTSIEYTPEFEKLLCDFYYTIKKAQGQAEAELLGCIEKEARLGTWQAAAWILERKYRNRWAKEITVSQDGEQALDKFLNGVEDVADDADQEYGDYQDPLEGVEV